MPLLWIQASVFADEHSDVPQNNFLQSIPDAEITLAHLCQLFKNTYRELYQEPEHRPLEIMKLQTLLKYDLPPWYIVKELSGAFAQSPFIRIIRSHTVESAPEPDTEPMRTPPVHSTPKDVVEPEPAPTLAPKPTSKRRKISRRQVLPVEIPVSEEEGDATAESPAQTAKKRKSSGKRKNPQAAKAPVDLTPEDPVREHSEEALGTITVQQEAPIFQPGEFARSPPHAEVLVPSKEALGTITVQQEAPIFQPGELARSPPHAEVLVPSKEALGTITVQQEAPIFQAGDLARSPPCAEVLVPCSPLIAASLAPPISPVSPEPVPMIPCSQASSGPLETGRKIPDSQADPDSELPLCTMPDIPDDKCPEPELPQPRLPEPESPEPELPALSPPRLELPQPELLEEKPSSPQLPPLLPDSTPEPAVVPRRIRNSPKTGRSSVARPASERKTDLEKPTPIARTEAAKDTIVPNTQAIVQVPRSPQAPPPPFRGFTPINKPPPPSQYPQPVAPQSPGDQSECRIHPVPQPTPLSRVNAMHDLEYASMEQFEGRATPDLTGTEIIERGIALLRQQPRDDESLVDISEFFHLDRMPELEFLQDNVYPEERPAETSGRGERNNGLQQTPAPALSQPVDNSPFPQPLPLGYPSLPLTGRSFMGPPASDWVPTSYQLPVLSSQGNSFSNFATSQIPPPSTQMATQSSRMAELTNSQSITSDPASSIMPSPSPTAASPVATMTGAVSTWSFDNNYPSDSDSSQDIIPGSHGRTPESASRANTPLQAPAKVIAKSIQSRDEDMQKTIVVATRTRWAATAGTTTTRASGRVRDTRAAVGSDDKGIEEAVEILEAWKTPVIGKTKISRTRKTMGLGEPSASRQQAARTKSVTRSPVAKMRASTSSLIPVFPNEELEESEVKETGNSEGEEVVMATEPSTTGSLRATRSRSTVPKPAPSQPEKTPRRTTKSPSKASTATSSQAAKTQARASKATSSQTAKTPTQIPATTRITRSRNPTVTEPKITVFGETNDDNEVDGLTK